MKYILTLAIVFFHSAYVALPARAENEAEKLAYESDLLDIFCIDQGEWLKCYYQEPAKCRDVLRPIVHSCVSKYLADVQMPISLSTGLEKNIKIINCLNEIFPHSVGIKKRDDAFCKKQPEHLR